MQHHFWEETSPPPTLRATEPSAAQCVASLNIFFVASLLHIQHREEGKTVKTDAFLPKTRSHAPIAKEKVPAGRPTNRMKRSEELMRLRMYWSFALALAIAQLASCQKRESFNPALAGRFFPLHAGSSWTYQVTDQSGTRETLSDRVIETNPADTSGGAGLVVSDYSGLEVETRYLAEAGYITRIASLSGRTQIRLEERRFLPQYLWPDRTWSNTLSPFENSPNDFLKITQNHSSFLEADEVAVPAGRFANCIRIETEALYESPAGVGQKRYFIDWYAPDVGLVKTLVLSGGPDGREITRIELLRFAKSQETVAFNLPHGQSTAPVSSKSTVRGAPPTSLSTDR
jgi:hypothetical protein